MQFSAIVNRFIVKTKHNSALTNDLKRKEKFSKNDHSCRISLFKGVHVQPCEINKMSRYVITNDVSFR